MASLRLASVNIERDLHLDLVLSFLELHKPDVTCIQELREDDVAKFIPAAGEHVVYVPTIRHRSDGFKALVGLGIFSRPPITASQTHYYIGSSDYVPKEELPEKSGNAAVIIAKIDVHGTVFSIANTHFLWSSQGQATDGQRDLMPKLLDILAEASEFVLCGDFNAPRIYQGAPGEIFSMLASHYKDNIPATYLTSIDASIHRNGRIRPGDFVDKMVDGLFTTPEYSVNDVELHSGVSDHMAITATIQK